MYRREATIRYFRAQGCPLHEAEDLTQEVQVRLYLARLRGVSITPGYWHSTCRSVLNDYLRHLRQQRQWLVSLEECTNYPAPANADDNDTFLETCLQVLCEQQREVLRLHVIEEWSFAEIAEVLGKSPEAVQKQYQRAIARLRKYFCSQDKRGGGRGYPVCVRMRVLFRASGGKPVLFCPSETSFIYGRLRRAPEASAG
jgi:RNA polymerase sigma factor (sigma-70 family)